MATEILPRFILLNDTLSISVKPLSDFNMIFVDGKFWLRYYLSKGEAVRLFRVIGVSSREVFRVIAWDKSMWLLQHLARGWCFVQVISSKGIYSS